MDQCCHLFVAAFQLSSLADAGHNVTQVGAASQSVVERRSSSTEAFGGRVAVVDVHAKSESARSRLTTALGSRKSRSEAFCSPRRCSITLAIADDIHWGNLLTNNVRSLRLATVLDPADLLTGSDLLHLVTSIWAPETRRASPPLATSSQ